MAFCAKCGTQTKENERFCPKCGSPVAGASRQGETSQQTGDQSGYHQQRDAVNQQDVQQNKVMAVLAYCFCLWFIPLVAAKDSRFARFHAGQGLNIFILWLIEIVVYAIINAIAWATFSWGAIWGVSIIFTIISILIAVLEIIGIVNAVKGEMKEVPVVGKWRILK